jgi:hypothetical protein
MLTIANDPRVIERLFRQAVTEEIQSAWAAGLSPIQVRDGFLVALQPDGQVRRLYRVAGFD